MMPSWVHPFPRPGGSSSGPGSSSWQRGPSGRTGPPHPSLPPTPRARGAGGRTIPRPRSATGAGRPCIEGSDPRPDSPGRWSGPSGRSSDLRRRCSPDERASLRPKRWCASEHAAPTRAGDAPRLGALAELKERSLDRPPLANGGLWAGFNLIVPPAGGIETAPRRSEGAGMQVGLKQILARVFHMRWPTRRIHKGWVTGRRCLTRRAPRPARWESLPAGGPPNDRRVERHEAESVAPARRRNSAQVRSRLAPGARRGRAAHCTRGQSEQGPIVRLTRDNEIRRRLPNGQLWAVGRRERRKGLRPSAAGCSSFQPVMM